MRRNLIAHFEEGTSDKIYMACIRANDDGTYTVMGKWGRRGHTLSSQVKLTTRDMQIASQHQHVVFAEKISKGYVDIDSQRYRGNVTRNEQCVREAMEPEENNPVPVQKKKSPQKDTEELLNSMNQQKVSSNVALCVDNTGIEDKFDEGIEYVCEKHPQKDMIYVYDRFGNKAEYLRKRFEQDGDIRYYQPKAGDRVRM